MEQQQAAGSLQTDSGQKTLFISGFYSETRLCHQILTDRDVNSDPSRQSGTNWRVEWKRKVLILSSSRSASSALEVKRGETCSRSLLILMNPQFIHNFSCGCIVGIT